MSEHITPIAEVTTETMAAWNIKAGGYASYEALEYQPRREVAIANAVDTLKGVYGVSTLTLTDAHKWDDRYGDEVGIAAHLGFEDARFTRINDARLNENHGAGIGIAIASDREITQSGELDLGSRQGLGVILDIGKHGLQLAGVYLDDLSEDARRAQVCALFSELEPDMPTIINGDVNALRRDFRDASLDTKVRNMMARVLALVLPKHNELGITISGMNERTVIPMFEQAGWTDADRVLCRPTAMSPEPRLFGLDYAFSNSGVNISGFRVPNTGKASDHRPIVYTAQVA